MKDDARASVIRRLQARLIGRSGTHRSAADAFASLPIPTIKEPKGRR